MPAAFVKSSVSEWSPILCQKGLRVSKSFFGLNVVADIPEAVTMKRANLKSLLFCLKAHPPPFRQLQLGFPLALTAQALGWFRRL